MNKGSFSKIFTVQTTHRIPKIATLALTTAVLVSMVAIDASASPNSIPSISGTAKNSAVLASESSLSELFGLGRHHPVRPTAPTTTTTDPTSTAIVTSTSGGGGGGTSGGGASSPSTTTTTDPAPTTTTTDPAPTTTTTDPAPTTTTTTTDPAPVTAYPVGTVDSSEVSGYAAPGANALPGYSETYETNFPGTTLPSAWGSYEGQPGGDPGAQFDQAHVSVGGGMLSIKTYQDSNFNNEWVTGGTCMCNVPGQLYGAWFVRSRLTGAGPTGVELLWPDANVWPPEVDFNETNGSVSATTATVHYSSSNTQIGRSTGIDMTQWHTWGVIWTSSEIIYTVDGTVWGTVTNTASIPTIPMHLSLQSQTWCSSGWACPSTPQSMQVNWVAMYAPNS
ncbi:MAG: glycoside hydrolase family 16 protein [Acidimicrobiales bacterium]